MRSLTALTAVMILVGGCATDPAELNGPNIQLSHGSMSARIDGDAWIANAALSVTFTGGVLAFAGSDVATATVGVGLIPTGPGTYPIGPTQPTNANVSLGTPNSWSASSAVGSGSITLTTFTANSASGTFFFTAEPVATTGATGTKVVTEGVFDVTF